MAPASDPTCQTLSIKDAIALAYGSTRKPLRAPGTGPCCGSRRIGDPHMNRSKMASPIAREKGKGRAKDLVESSTALESSFGMEDDTATTADYETAMESALFDQPSQSTNRYREGSNGGASHEAGEEDDAEFVYDGKDDEDMRIFREEAKLESLDYQDRLRGILGDAAEVDEPVDYDGVAEPPTPRPPSFGRANGPTMSTPPRSPSGSTYSSSDSPTTAQRRNAIDKPEDIPSPSLPAQRHPLPAPRPFPRPKAQTPSVSSPTSSSHSSSFQPESSILSPQSSRFGSLPIRRPPMNPLVSRLRSTSATPSQSFRGVRSVSQASSLASLANQDVDEYQGFANDTFARDPNDSFMSTGKNNHYLPSLGGSRRSSVSNLKEAAQGGVDMSPSLSSNVYREGDMSNATLFPPARRKGHAAPLSEVHQLVPPFKWTVLKRLSQRLFSLPSNNGKGAAVIAEPGSPTCLAVSGGLIVVGSTKGWTMIYDYSQSLKAIAGNEDISKQCGPVSALAISQDSTFIAVAYNSGHIHLYEWGKKPGIPARTVNPTSLQAVNAGKAEGHLARDVSGNGSIIQYLSFVGRRHTAIVSGDQYGLAFYHSLGKVLGLANTDILRILGKYPSQLANHLPTAIDADGIVEASQSRLLGVQILPLGTEEHFTDEYNLVALLTAGKIVVAGLKPTPRTWWRHVNQAPSSSQNRNVASSRSSEAGIADQETGTKHTRLEQGCLAWLPSIDGAPPLLAWCWSGCLRIARVERETSERALNGKEDNLATSRHSSGLKASQNGSKASASILVLRLLTRNKLANGRDAQQTHSAHDPLYKCENTISALQWLNRHTIALLTTRRILLFDLDKLALVEESSYFGPDFVVPRDRPLEASFKAYKGKLFYLTARDLRAGSVLSWADRVLHLVSSGQLVQAIELLVLYYGAKDEAQSTTPSLPFSTLELPEDPTERKVAVEPRLREILVASADYAFSEQRMRNEATLDRHGSTRGIDSTEFFENLVGASIRASLATGSFDFLFNDLADRYADNGIEGIFLERLEPFILSGEIKNMPVAVSQQLVARHADRDELREAEDLIWHIDPHCLDVNQAVSICSKHRLYEALIYVYTRALQDFVGPLVELIDLIATIVQDRRDRPPYVATREATESFFQTFGSDDNLEVLVPAAYTVYSYLADSLVGLSHPSQEPLDTEAALNAKRSLYTFVFSPGLQTYPPGSNRVIRTATENSLSMPYLRLLLRFDTEATLDCLDIALEDSYLDEDATAFGTVDRQGVITTLLAILRDESEKSSLVGADRTFINIFISRNLPKYSQFVKLEPVTMHQILTQLALDSDLSTHQDRELAVEFLLSTYTPSYDSALLDLLEKAQFYQVLISIYRSQKAWPRLASVYLRDIEQGQNVFLNLAKVLLDAKRDDNAQLALVKSEILANALSLVGEGVTEFVDLIESHLPEEQAAAVEALRESPPRQMAYLRCLLEPQLDEESARSLRTPSKHATDNLRYMYVGLLSRYDPPSVMRYLKAEPSLDEKEIVQICKERENFEAVIWIQASDGDISQSLDTARNVLQSQSDLVIRGLLSRGSSQNMHKAMQQVIDVGRTAIQVAGKTSRAELSTGMLTVEDLWYRVLSSLIDTVRDVSRNIRTSGDSSQPSGTRDMLAKVKQLIPDAISVLISTTSSETLALPHLVRRLMDSSADSTYAEYKGILDSMLDTYRFEGNLLSTSKRLLEADVHQEVAELVKTRGTGWRPDTSGVCEACGRSVWTRVNEKDRLSNPQLVVRSASELEVSEKLKIRPKVRRRPSLKGKETDWYEEEAPKTNQDGPSSQSLVVFRGGAICHAACLEQGERVR